MKNPSAHGKGTRAGKPLPEGIENPLDRLKAESPEAFAAFQVYCRQGPRRSIRKTAGTEGVAKTVRLLQRWSGNNYWPARARLYDNRVAEAERKGMELGALERAEELARRRMHVEDESYATAAALMDVVAKMLKFPLVESSTSDGGLTTIIRPTKWQLGNAAQLAQVAATLYAVGSGANSEGRLDDDAIETFLRTIHRMVADRLPEEQQLEFAEALRELSTKMRLS